MPPVISAADFFISVSKEIIYCRFFSFLGFYKSDHERTTDLLAAMVDLLILF